MKRLFSLDRRWCVLRWLSGRWRRTSLTFTARDKRVFVSVKYKYNKYVLHLLFTWTSRRFVCWFTRRRWRTSRSRNPASVLQGKKSCEICPKSQVNCSVIYVLLRVHWRRGFVRRSTSSVTSGKYIMSGNIKRFCTNTGRLDGGKIITWEVPW